MKFIYLNYLVMLVASVMTLNAQSEVLTTQVNKTVENCTYETVFERSFNQSVQTIKGTSVTEITEEVLSDSLYVKTFTFTSVEDGQDETTMGSGKSTTERYGDENNYTLVTMAESEVYFLDKDGVETYRSERVPNRIITEYVANENGTTTQISHNLETGIKTSYLQFKIEIDENSHYTVSYLSEPSKAPSYSLEFDDSGNVIGKKPTDDYTKTISAKSVCLVKKVD